MHNRILVAAGWMANCWRLRTRIGGLRPRMQPFIFCHLCWYRRANFILTKYEKVIYVKICHKAKLQDFVKIQMTRNPLKTFQNRRVFREMNNLTLVELSSKLIQQTLVSIVPDLSCVVIRRRHRQGSRKCNSTNLRNSTKKNLFYIKILKSVVVQRKIGPPR